MLNSMRFRIIKDQFNGYEVQYRAWYHFRWQQAFGTNSFRTLPAAIERVQLLRKKYYGKALPEVVKEWGE